MATKPKGAQGHPRLRHYFHWGAREPQWRRRRIARCLRPRRRTTELEGSQPPDVANSRTVAVG